MRAPRTLILSLACLAALAWAATAAALIVPQHSIRGIGLNKQTRAEVRAKVGDPLGVRHGMNDFGRYTIFRYRKLKVTFQGNAKVTAVSTKRHRQRTAEGIHVGSTEEALRSAYPKARCRTEGPHFRHCWTGRLRAGGRVTDYRIGMLTRRVKSVLVAFVID